MIVVYYSDESCIASTAFGQLLEQHGYAHVLQYTGGLQEWGSRELFVWDAQSTAGHLPILPHFTI